MIAIGLIVALSFPEIPRSVSVCRISDEPRRMIREPNDWVRFARSDCLLKPVFWASPWSRFADAARKYVALETPPRSDAAVSYDGPSPLYSCFWGSVHPAYGFAAKYSADVKWNCVAWASM